MCLSACQTTRRTSTGQVTTRTGCLSARVKLTVPNHGAVLTVNGILKLKQGERMQLSFLMPILRSEVARVELSPDRALLVDRMGRRFVEVDGRELKQFYPRKNGFARLEKLLYAAARPGGKRILEGRELGIPSLRKGQIELYDFSDKTFDLPPTRLSSRYKEVPLSELLEMLLSL